MRTIKRLLCCMLFVSTYGIGMLAQENQSYFLHTIEKGQSLYSIASMYGVSQADIVKLNPGSDEKYTLDVLYAYLGLSIILRRKHFIPLLPVKPFTG